MRPPSMPGPFEPDTHPPPASSRPRLRIGCVTRTYLVPQKALWANLARYVANAATMLLPPDTEPGLAWSVQRSQPDQFLSVALVSGQIDRLVLHCQIEYGGHRGADLVIDPEYPSGRFRPGARKERVDRICFTVFEGVAVQLAGDPHLPHRQHDRLPAKGSAWITIEGRTWRGELLDSTPDGLGLIIPESGDHQRNHPLGDLQGRTGALRRKALGLTEYHAVRLVRVGVRRNGIHIGLHLLDHDGAEVAPDHRDPNLSPPDAPEPVHREETTQS